LADPSRLLTPPIISKLPLGLLDFLGIKTGGRYPDQLASFLQPTWDLERYQTIWDERNTFDVASPITALNLNTSTIVVPNTELWLVHQFNGFLQTDAAEAVAATLAWVDSYNFVNLASGVTILAASQQRHVSGANGTSFLVGPGSIFGWLCDQITGASIVAQVFVRYTRFRV